MKRTNLVLDEELLKTVTRLLGEKTYSAAVNRALEETIKLVKLRKLENYFGSGVWEGNLSQMRKDQMSQKSSRKRNFKK